MQRKQKVNPYFLMQAKESSQHQKQSNFKHQEILIFTIELMHSNIKTNINQGCNECVPTNPCVPTI